MATPIPDYSMLSKFGYYGVSIFYILSGLTLFHVYEHRFNFTLSEIKIFFKKRLFRIFPLLILTTLLSSYFVKTDLKTIILNITGLFGIFAWDKAIVTGGWSIGNELVFYCFFPIILLFSKRNTKIFILIILTALLTYIYFAFWLIDTENHWHNYTNPFNQIFLFISGIVIGRILKYKSESNVIPLIFILIGLFIFYFPLEVKERQLLVSYNYRLVYTAASILICTGFYKLTYTLPNILNKPLTILGEASYSVYLLHMFVFYSCKILNTKFFNFPISYIILPSIIATIISSYICYMYFEKPFVRLGSQKTTNLS
jgi:peptidoglycan/LPS O-acetylase OafA/YrhL